MAKQTVKEVAKASPLLRLTGEVKARAKRSSGVLKGQLQSLQDGLPGFDKNSSLPFAGRLLTVVRQYARKPDREGRIETMSKKSKKKTAGKIGKKAAKKVAKKAGKKAAAKAVQSTSLSDKKAAKVQKKATKAALEFAKKGKKLSLIHI